MRTRPSYIPETVVGAPIDFPWEGADSHIGPTEGMTPLLKMLEGKTTFGFLSLGAGILQWAGWRLLHHTDVSHNLDLAEALFAYQVDSRYLKRSARPPGLPPDEPPALSASRQFDWLMMRAADPEEYWHSYYVPIMEVFHCAHLVRHILPKSAWKDFGDWLKVISKRLDELASAPDEPFRKKSTFPSLEAYHAFTARHRGMALPAQVIDPAFSYKPEQREELIDAYLAGLNWRENRYLHSPDELRATGFEGRPYRLG